MTNNDVRRIYTQKVSELLAKGYQIHYETMSGSQGELAHIDLSDGNEILRVLLEREGNYGGSYGNIVRLRVGRCNEDLSRTHTIWNERLDTLFEIEWDQISGNYYTTREEGARMAAVRLERWRRRGHSSGGAGRSLQIRSPSLDTAAAPHEILPGRRHHPAGEAHAGKRQDVLRNYCQGQELHPSCIVPA